jgi:Ricin-type beta-trefoil lectin domain
MPGLTRHLRCSALAAAVVSLAAIAAQGTGPLASAADSARAVATAGQRMVTLQARPAPTSSSGTTYYELYSGLTGLPPLYEDLCLEADGSGTIGNGTKVLLGECDGSADELWTFVAQSGTAVPPQANGPGYELVNEDGGYCLDAETAPTPIGNGTDVQVWKCNSTAQQAWFSSIVLNGGDRAEINGHTDPANGSPLCLDAPSGADYGTAGEQIEVVDCAYTAGQFWGAPPVKP